MDNMNFNVLKLNEEIKEIYKKYFFDYKIDVEEVILKLNGDYDYMCNIKTFNYDGIYCLIFYRLSFEIVNKYKNIDLIDFLYKIKNISKEYTSSYISPYSIVFFPISIGYGVEIDKGFKIFNYCVFGNNVNLIDKNYGLFDKKITIINKNTIIKSNVKIYADSNIGENVVVNDNCIINENLPNNSAVELVTNLQIKKNKISSRIPSQELIAYGIVPKYKNTFVIYGEGFYNPKVKLLVDKYSVETEISYWDKNKIIVKIKSLNVENNSKNMLILFSNGQRIVLTNHVGLQKSLKNLKI